MASTPSAEAEVPSVQVTKTEHGTHIVHVRNFSKLGREHCSDDGSVTSPVFTVSDLDWIVRYFPDGEGQEEDRGYVSAFVELVTEGAAAWAYVSLLALDQTTGLPDPDTANLWDEDQDPTLFDASRAETRRSWSIRAPRSELEESGFVDAGDDCLRIECVLDVCLHRLYFDDPPAPEHSPLDAGLLASAEGADVVIHVGAAPAATIHAHSAVLDAHAPRFLTEHAATTADATRVVTVDDMPPVTVEAFIHFVYTDTLPVVAGMSGDGYKDVLRHLLLAGKRYGVPRLAAICKSVLGKHLDVDSAAATLAMADRHGFDELRAACVEFVSDPWNYALVRKSEGYPELYRDAPHLAREACIKYANSYGVDVVFDEQTNLLLEISGPRSQLHDLPEKFAPSLPSSQIREVMISDSSVKFTLNHFS